MLSKKGIILALFSAIAFGIYPPSAQLAYADGANSIFMIIATTFFRAFTLVCYCLSRGQKIIPESNSWKIVFTGGFFQSLSILGIIASLEYLPGPITIIVVFTHTIMLLFYMAYRHEIKLTKIALYSTLSALVGLSFVLDVWSQEFNLSLIGLTLAFIAALATTSRLYIYGKQVMLIPPAVVGAQTFSMAFVFTLSFIIFRQPILPRDIYGYLWTVLCATGLSLGTFGMFFGIAIMGSFQWSLFLKLEPVFTALFSVLLLGEILKTEQYFGIILVLSSLVLYQILELRTKTLPAGITSTKQSST